MFGIQEINAPQLSSLMQNEPDSFHLVDVRSLAEMAQGMLPAAEAVPMHLVPLRIDEWRERPKIVFYCRTGMRSAQVCGYLQQQGVNQVVNLRGGIVDWHRQGLPIEMPEASSLAG